MNNSKKIEYASVDITIPYPSVIDGKVKFRETTENHVLTNFFVPFSIETEEQLTRYLGQLLYESDCDIASIRDLYVHGWNEV
jgi:hypothetical protein